MSGGSSKHFLVRVAAEKLEFGLSRLCSAGSRSVVPISHSSWTSKWPFETCSPHGEMQEHRRASPTMQAYFKPVQVMSTNPLEGFTAKAKVKGRV